MRFFVTNNSAISEPGPDGGADVYEITLGSNGYGEVALDSANEGGVFAAMEGLYGQTFQVILSNNGQS